MTDNRNPPDDPNADRRRRLRDALRENLKRRKSQARGRAEQPLADCDAEQGPALLRKDRAPPQR